MTKKTVSHRKTPHRRAARAKTPPGERGIWTGTISFGLVNIGVKVVSARERQELHFTMLDPSNLSPVGYKYYNKTSGEDVSRSKTVKAYEYKAGKYVVMSEGDFKKANPKATQTIDIESFAELSEIDPVFFERAYYLLPTKGAEKAYHLLREALLRTEKVAIAKIVLHTKQHLVAIIPRGKFLLLELLHFAEDVKELEEIQDWKMEAPSSRTLQREVEMAEHLISRMTERWNPSAFKDTYREDLMSRVKAKVRAGKATEITEDIETSEETSSSKVVDLMPLLKKSLSSRKTSSKSVTH